MATGLRGSTDLLREPEDRVPGTPLGQHVSDEVLLAVVGGENGDLVRRIALQPHEHEEGHSILRLPQVLRGEASGIGSAQDEVGTGSSTDFHSRYRDL